MTAEEIESLKKIVKQLNDIIAKAENGEENTADTPIVLTAPASAIENKKKLLEGE